ncbi:MAG: bifunctional DNA-formamidopyrimidine glycosylase/DNA-(apurinic or apyrimidinic site) lyase [Patescibacteria group bacterium]
MPELPEVQTIVDELEQKIKNKTISSVQVTANKSVNLPNKKFVRLLLGKKVLEVTRRAKMIIVELSANKYLLIHLKMTGQLVFKDKRGRGVSGGHPIAVKGELPNKFTRVSFAFKGGSQLFFNDIRRFGWIKLVDKKIKDQETAKYGLEPLEDDFTQANFKKALGRYPKRKIKQVLLDQTLIAGVGNIYADEACFAARILPTRPAESLKEKEIKDLWRAIPKILKFSISKKGTSADTYVTTSGEEGAMMKHLKVYGRNGERCKVCGEAIKKMRLAGRGTHYCLKCQK